MNEIIRPGELRQWVSIIDDTTPESASGGKAPWVSYSVAASLWAKVEPVRGGREGFGNPEWTITTVPYDVTMRRRSNILETQRILFGTRQFHIHAVPQVDRSQTYMTLTCSEVS